MAIFLDRIDAAPLEVEDFNPFLYQWISNLVDSLNETLEDIDNALNLDDNGILIPHFTQAEIVAFNIAGVPDGTMWYCTNSVPQNVVIQINGALQQLTTTAFP
jgi:hypothetical protein